MRRHKSAAGEPAGLQPLSEATREEIVHGMLEQPQLHDPQHDSDKLSLAEVSALVRARQGGHALVDAAASAANRLVVSLQQNYFSAVGAKADQLAFERRGSVRAAKQACTTVERRHADDGPEDRRRRRVHKGLPLAAFGMAAIVETTYLAGVLAQIVDAPSMWSREGLPGLLIGVLVAMASYTAGLLLASPYARYHDRKEFADKSQMREPDWRLPVGFTLLVAGVLASWAWLRAHNEAVVPGGGVPVLPVVLLMLLLSATGVILKILSYNPFADAASATTRARMAADAAQDRHRANVLHTGAALEQAWLELAYLLAALTQHCTGQYDDAWQLILKARWLHGRSGVLSLQLADAGHDADAVHGNLDIPDPARIAALFEIAVPAPVTRQLIPALEALHRYHPDKVKQVALAQLTDLDLGSADDPTDSSAETDRTSERPTMPEGATDMAAPRRTGAEPAPALHADNGSQRTEPLSIGVGGGSQPLTTSDGEASTPTGDPT
jgi:hypothetical protein